MKTKRIFSLLMGMAIVLTFFPTTALAEEMPTSMSVQNGNIEISEPGIYVISDATTSYTVRVDGNVGNENDPVNITLDNVNIDVSASGGCAFSIGAGSYVNLTLKGDNTLTSGPDDAGLCVPEGATLNISEDSATTDTDSLSATSTGYGAGIGGGGGGDCGTITINGGTVTATCSNSSGYYSFGAGIGGGGGGSGGSGGNVTINGGEVTATCSSSLTDCVDSWSYSFGAGIGGGGGSVGSGGSGGNVTINGGEVTATCSSSLTNCDDSSSSGYGAGIGGGGGMHGIGGSGVDIKITGGTVTAACSSSLTNCNSSDSYSFGAGIGGGNGGSGGDGGNVTITGSTVTATCNGSDCSYGAGIGGGSGGSGGDGGNVTITDSTVTATCSSSGSSYGAGIGGGSGSGGSGGSVEITGGTITAECNGSAGSYGAGIGGGYNNGNGGIITINSGEVTSKCNSSNGNWGAGIGGGSGGSGGIITINGGTVTAKCCDGTYFGNRGAGIGGGASGDGGTITINGGSITASCEGSGAGVGGGSGGNGGAVYISGGSVYASNLWGISIGAGLSASDKGTLQNNSSAKTPVYFTTMTLRDTTGAAVGKTSVSLLTASLNKAAYTYGTKDMQTDSDGKLYLYLPENTATVKAQADGGKYVGSVITTTDTAASLGTLTLSSVSGVTPDGADAPISGSIVITFIGEMNTSVTGTVSLNGGTALTGGVWSGGNKVYTIPYSGLSYSAGYTVAVSGFKDAAGNTITADSTYSFTTLADTVKPTVSGVIPNESNALNSGDLIITFSEAMNTTTGTVSLGGTALTGGAWSNENKTYTVPYSGLAYSTRYNATISGFKDAAGNEMESDSTHSFTTLAAPIYDDTVYFTIKSSAGTGGSISPNGSASVADGNDKTYKIVADAGYEIKDVLVDGVSVGAVGTYTFENVKKAHVITASFAKKKVVNPFTDVKNSDWFYNNVMYVYENGLMNGTNSDTFNPTGGITRGMFVTVLYRLSGDTGSYTNGFADVPSGKWYENAVAWAAKNGIAGGIGNDRFAPDSGITRQQLAVLLYNYAKYKGYDVSVGEDTNILSYKDALSISDYAYPALQWACGAGIMDGGNEYLNPNGPATRAQVAAMLQRFVENVAK